MLREEKVSSLEGDPFAHLPNEVYGQLWLQGLHNQWVSKKSGHRISSMTILDI